MFLIRTCRNKKCEEKHEKISEREKNQENVSILHYILINLFTNILQICRIFDDFFFFFFTLYVG